MKVAVIGSGSWGTALAYLLATGGHEVMMYARNEAVVASVNERHVNPRYLSDVRLPDVISATSSYSEAFASAQAAVLVTPSAIVRDVAQAIAPSVPADLPIIICSKGIEEGSGCTLVEVLAQELGNEGRIAALSGPNHAEEVVKGVPAATVIASSSADTAAFFQELFVQETFRTYVSDDVRGVELCAAYKNIIAIAVGVSYGLGFGDNTAALLITRGLAEMSRLVVAVGGKAFTCMGLAGTGDMVVTCMSDHSRNRRLGCMLAEGKTLDDFVKETHMVAEGAIACKTIDVLARRFGVDTPIAKVVRGIVWGSADPRAALPELMSRSLKTEFYGIEG